MWYVYILELRNGAYYTGITKNIIKRFQKHNAGKGSKYVRAYLPCELVYIGLCKDHSTALKEEARIKRLKKYLKLLLILGETNIIGNFKPYINRSHLSYTQIRWLYRLLYKLYDTNILKEYKYNSFFKPYRTFIKKYKIF